MQPTAGSPRDESLRLADRRTALLYIMKTRLLQATLADSFAPAQSPLPCCFPARGVDSHFPDAHPFGLPVYVPPLPARSILASGG